MYHFLGSKYLELKFYKLAKEIIAQKSCLL